jgi:hypothetical protein
MGPSGGTEGGAGEAEPGRVRIRHALQLSTSARA